MFLFKNKKYIFIIVKNVKTRENLYILCLQQTEKIYIIKGFVYKTIKIKNNSSMILV